MLQNGPGRATLFIPNVTAKHSGQYICTAKHLNITQTIHANITVRFPPKILNGSECVRQSEVLTCVCISEGVPLPTIKWPLLENHAEYSVLTTVINHTVNSRVSFSVTAHSNTTVMCVSNSETGEANRNLTVTRGQGHSEPSAALLPVAVVSVIVNVIFIICIVFLWNSRKKLKPDQEDRTYMSMQKKDRSPEYDVIAHRSSDVIAQRPN
uniref:V-set and immunoglobulin domain-containing protein 1-like isoform X2 n=1 Tax=Monopterus albus TaxID=43700 RepID=UPI0009B47B59|nr:V-set and immunoglobulin domain-containing protein 1-like isoform X2 [Monopterus albus]